MGFDKTNAMRILEKAKISYEVETYGHHQEAVDGMHVAAMLHQDENTVFKTLVTITNTKEYVVFVIPVNHELDLKKCAKVAGTKSIEMIHVKELQKITGYIRGGCSPIGMKKAFRTYLHESALEYTHIMFSGGKIGTQIKMNPKDMIHLLHIHIAYLIK